MDNLNQQTMAGEIGFSISLLNQTKLLTLDMTCIIVSNYHIYKRYEKI
jgi:hypothetical protein